jgi:hypothetical protein
MIEDLRNKAYEAWVYGKISDYNRRIVPLSDKPGKILILWEGQKLTGNPLKIVSKKAINKIC